MSIKIRLIAFFLLFGIVPASCLMGVYFWYKGSTLGVRSRAQAMALARDAGWSGAVRSRAA